MKNIGKYMVAGLMLVGISACSNDSDGLLSSESVDVSRNAELVTVTIDLGTTPGQLQTKLEAEMSDVSTLQKLILTGEFNEADVNYWLNNLKHLVEFDLSGATPKHSINGDSYSGQGQNLGVNGLHFDDNQIGAYIFIGMDKLKKIVFPNNSNITSMGDGVCFGCLSLTTMEIPASITWIGNQAFQYCNFTDVKIPNTVTGLGNSIFVDNLNLNSVELLADVEEIPGSMFVNCEKLQTVVLSNKIKKVGSWAFENCYALKDYTPFSNIEVLDYGAFHASGLESADLSNVTDFSNAGWAFRLCESLKSVTLPSNLTETLPSYMFWGCTSLNSINFPVGMEKIGDGVLGACGFTELTIPSTVKKIGYDSFRANASLTKVTLSEGLEEIDSYGFLDTSITEISIPSTVTKIGYGAFQNSKLITLTVPATVREIGGSLIDNCSDLKALIWNSTVLEIADTWSVNSDCLLYLPNADYVPGPNWKNIIVNGEAETLELCTDGNRTDGNRSFFVPVAFTAKKISFSRNFGSTTYPGVSSGWQTIVLPFTPTKIEHETKGVIAPFNSEVADAKPFWLRELTTDGFVDKTTIEPNKAYIIAMPNHSDYVEEYRLNGKITFSAENVELAATPETLTASDGPTFSLQPTYQKVDRGLTAYTLNIDYWIDGYEYGSVFVRNISDTYAFEAYVTTAGRSARSVFEMDTRSSATRGVPYKPNTSGIPQIGDM